MMGKLKLQMRFIKRVQNHSAGGYRMMWERTRKNPKDIELLVAAYLDGMNAAIGHLIEADLVEIIYEEN